MVELVTEWVEKNDCEVKILREVGRMITELVMSRYLSEQKKERGIWWLDWEMQLLHLWFNYFYISVV